MNLLPKITFSHTAMHTLSRTFLLFAAIAVLAACDKSEDKGGQSDDKDAPKSNVDTDTKTKPAGSAYVFAETVWEMGPKSMYVADCKFLYECDCCRMEYIFDTKDHFYALDHCSEGNMLMEGTYTVTETELVLEYSKYLVEEVMIEGSETEAFSINATTRDPQTFRFPLGSETCGDQPIITLVEGEHTSVGAKVGSTVAERLQMLEDENFLPKLAVLKEGSNQE
ncbi:MAG: hypothetical protein AAF570_18025 [Bacteroidota bacterium]